MGKSSAWRKGTNWSAYRESDYWAERDKRLAKQKKEQESSNVSEHITVKEETSAND